MDIKLKEDQIRDFELKVQVSMFPARIWRIFTLILKSLHTKGKEVTLAKEGHKRASVAVLMSFTAFSVQQSHVQKQITVYEEEKEFELAYGLFLHSSSSCYI